MGKAMAGVLVSFAVSSGGGTITGNSATTDAFGVATAPAWILGSVPGANTLRASVSGGSNPTAQITATARPPRWTVLVFMAADNNLALSGVGDIEEMEAAGANPEVQVVVQAEFNPATFSRVSVTPATLHLPNYNTFRYAFGGLTPLATARVGPNGSTTDIGNRNMTDPSELRAFIQYGKATYPAEHYAVVLWNHGGGYQGLLTDETTAGGRMMTLSELKSGLAGVGTIDMLDFDMCLMGGYEALEAVNGVASTVAFSQEVEPGDGDPYTSILQTLYQSPSMDGRALASTVVEKYNAYYMASGRSSTTKSAYDLSGYAAFENALNALATSLTASANTLSLAVASGSRVSQKFTFPIFTDISSLMDSLSVRVTSASLKSQMADVKTQVTAPGFRIANRAFSASAYGNASVTRANGLSLVLPSGASAADWFQPTGGTLSLSAYRTAMPNKAWTTFLGSYVTALTAPVVSYVDLGANRWEIYAIWDTASVSRAVDVDLWVVEPNGNLYIPFLGTVTPNGAMSNDSQKEQTYFEAYSMNRYVQVGRYKFYVDLWADPQNHRPVYDIVSRKGATATFASLYAPNYPSLSLQTSWLKDQSATFAKIEGGSYTDLRYAAYLDVNAAGSDAIPLSGPVVISSPSLSTSLQTSSAVAPPSFSRTGTMAVAENDITEAQLRTVRANWAGHIARRNAALAASLTERSGSRGEAARLAPPAAMIVP
jgi:hypothetical protein